MTTANDQLTVKQIAAELGVSDMTAHKLITTGALPAVNVGLGSKCYWRVSRADLNGYLDRKREETARRFRGTVA